MLPQFLFPPSYKLKMSMILHPSFIFSCLNKAHTDGSSAYSVESKKSNSDGATNSGANRFKNGAMMLLDEVMMTSVSPPILGFIVGFGYGMWKNACPHNCDMIKAQNDKNQRKELVDDEDQNRATRRNIAESDGRVSVTGLKGIFAPPTSIWNRYSSEVSFTIEKLTISLIAAAAGAAVGFGAARLLVKKFAQVGNQTKPNIVCQDS
jgi:hypothetical protein